MIDSTQVGERAVLVNVRDRGIGNEDQLQEFRELVAAAGVYVVDVIDAPQKLSHPRYLIGSGKAGEIETAVAAGSLDVVIFNQPLSPAQVRNLESTVHCRVIDRIDLILDIFAQRARSFEGKLQVELAQLEHMSTRLVRGWTHLERQKGGIGLRGPGETQLETDRRLIARRIRQINARLSRVRRQRHDSTRARRRAHLSTVSLVGYTNAGKSTLFNTLTGADGYAADQLFATLDTTLRRFQVPGEKPVLMSDTVGFIRDLPHELIAAFHATLEETREADLLLHVIDASAPDRKERIAEVDKVLAEIGADGIPRIDVYNKIDLAPELEPRVDRDAGGIPVAVWISAVSGAGISQLITAIAERINQHKQRCRVRVPAHAGRLRARLYGIGAVYSETATDEGWLLEIGMDLDRLRALWGAEGLDTPAHEAFEVLKNAEPCSDRNTVAYAPVAATKG